MARWLERQGSNHHRDRPRTPPRFSCRHGSNRIWGGFRSMALAFTPCTWPSTTTCRTCQSKAFHQRTRNVSTPWQWLVQLETLGRHHSQTNAQFQSLASAALQWWNYVLEILMDIALSSSPGITAGLWLTLSSTCLSRGYAQNIWAMHSAWASRASKFRFARMSLVYEISLHCGLQRASGYNFFQAVRFTLARHRLRHAAAPKGTGTFSARP